MKSIISVKNLRKNFTHYKKEPGLLGAFKGLFKREEIPIEAVAGISFEIREGEFVGFVGPNGAGKTTTLKMLSGILYPSSGEVHVLGYLPFKRQPEFQKQFSLVMGQKNQLWWDLPARETFELNQAIYEIPDEVYEKNLEELSVLLNIKDLLDVQVRKLSLGERMKCELTAALLHDPKILFLDEPTIGLDVVSQQAIRDFLRDYNRRKNATIILTSHYMEDIKRLCGRVMIIDHGHFIYDGNYKDLIEQFADTKTIEMAFSEEIAKDRLRPFGEVTDYRGYSARLIVPRSDITRVTTELLQKFAVDDISIHEKTMEEIVSEIFQGKKRAKSSS